MSADDEERESLRILNQATADHAETIADLLNVDGLALPKVARGLVVRGAKNLKFSAQASVVDLSKAVQILTIYGYEDRTESIARVVGSVPFLANGYFEVLRGIVQTVRWLVARKGEAGVAAELKVLAAEPADYRPLYLEDEQHQFSHPLDDPEARKSLGIDPGAVYVLPPAQRPQFFLQDLFVLAMIWGYGGSSVWPMERLETERARLERAMRDLPGMH